MSGRIPSPAEARAILDEWTQSPNLRKHALAVAAAMRAYALRWNEDPNRWEIVGLLHDFDYERYPDEHPVAGVKILRARGIDEEVIRDLLAHAPHAGQPRDTPARKAVFACDELAGFIVAVALVQPNKKLEEVTPERVQRKLKQKGFASRVSREDIEVGARELGVSLPEHIATVLQALQGIAGTLDL